MTPAQRSEAVRSGNATLRQMVEGLLDGPDELQLVCREFLARTDASLNELNCESAQLSRLDKQPLHYEVEVGHDNQAASSDRKPTRANKRRRLGLPRGYAPPLHRRNLQGG